ncbi:hypothetical protein GWE18_37050 [Bradyrhizobium sp. CSA112]|uniref:hypothetical protein n=1 Tax=Bradyrhizobium sp. CSA112 TaxID=2699170 RepID=UPI0023AF67D5|nr:hypothetical protein [Bradyrhizobium sp. CSA112]MDE5458311.1 hypothetical protein [Bradyrhizobium sp. CSA112]
MADTMVFVLIPAISRVAVVDRSTQTHSKFGLIHQQLQQTSSAKTAYVKRLGAVNTVRSFSPVIGQQTDRFRR